MAEKPIEWHLDNIKAHQSHLKSIRQPLLNTIQLGDCLDVMNDIEDESIDLILCDLPYGTTKNKWDIIIPFAPLWAHYNRIIKPKGNIVLTSAQPFTTDLINSNRKMFRYDLIWYKALGTGFLNSKKMPMRNHEHVCVFYKKLGTYNPQMGFGKRKSGMRKNDRNGGCYNDFNSNRIEKFDDGGTRYPQSVIDITNGDRTKESDHSTQKPEVLFRYFVKTYSNEGDLVLDNCIGSGTTAAACIQEGRHYIGIEKSPVEHAKAIKRIAKLKSQTKLFTPQQLLAEQTKLL